MHSSVYLCALFSGWICSCIQKACSSCGRAPFIPLADILILELYRGTHESRAQGGKKKTHLNPNCRNQMVGWIISIICIISPILQSLDECRDHLHAFFFFFPHSHFYSSPSSFYRSCMWNTSKLERCPPPLSFPWLFWVMMIRANTEPMFLI